MTMRYEVATQNKQLKLTLIALAATRAEAIRAARELARTSGVAWVHVFSVATGDAIFSMQA